MKKQILLFVAATLISVSSLMAQQGRMMQTPEERTKAAMEKIAAFDLKQDARTKVEAILTDFYKNQQASMQEMRANNTDRTVVMEKRKELADARDKKLKEVFTTDEYTKWINDIEPSLRPQRPGMQAPPAAPADKKAPATEKKAAPAN